MSKEIPGKLYIISDCSYSEKWTIECNKTHRVIPDHRYGMMNSWRAMDNDATSNLTKVSHEFCNIRILHFCLLSDHQTSKKNATVIDCVFISLQLSII